MTAALTPLAAWILLSGIDDLIPLLASLWWRFRARSANRSMSAEREPPKRIAIFIPLWHEAGVIGRMLEHNLAAIRYDSYEIFAGVYPNDKATAAAVRSVAAHNARVHLAVCPHDGPTSKADCLNWIFQCMLLYEEEHGMRFDVLITHDAEDLIHPEALDAIGTLSSEFEMVQVPVLPLPTPALELTHGVYCDDFAEIQLKDMPARQMLRSFLPSNGVGTGFSRAGVEKLAGAHQNCVFDPAALTEDYENGLRIHRLRGAQLFLPLQQDCGQFVATREYFPRKWSQAVRQRSRWTIGIVLQSWERYGWSGSWAERYWFWRDRKSIVGTLVSPLANLVTLYGVLTWCLCHYLGRPWCLAGAAPVRLAWLGEATLAFFAIHQGFRIYASGKVYGWRFAAAVPLRSLWGNFLNSCATVKALRQYCLAKWRHEPLLWLKTEHAYPNREALQAHKRRLGEILVDCGWFRREELEQALAERPADVLMGEYLVQSGLLCAEELYRALGVQQNLQVGVPEAPTKRAVRCLPAERSRLWRVLPFQVEGGSLYVASPLLPSDAMHEDLRRFTELEIRVQLVTPGEWDDLARRHLPQ